MMLQILKSKIQAVTVTESNIAYPGSISLPQELMTAARIRQFELVHVNNRTSGSRIITYAVRSTGEGRVTVNGAASHLFKKGDIAHVLSFAQMSEAEADFFAPVLVVANDLNRLVERKEYVLG